MEEYIETNNHTFCMLEFLKDLDQDQLSAVKYCDGSQLVIAGAGSGKTRVLTYKIAYLLSMGVKPWNILALTFTNKAANEMKERIGILLKEDAARRINMGTFHSIFYRILRSNVNEINYRPNFTIYDENDSKVLVKNIMKEFGVDDKKYSPGQILNTISYAKNHLITVDEFLMNDRTNIIGNIYNEYVQRCHIANVMDFDDLLINTYELFSKKPDVLNNYADLFKYILVDEYQDTNYAQQKIIELLYRKNVCICMVGDDAQSIYSFRGANLEYMLSFPQKNNFKIFKLERNYRSTKNIVAAANSLIKHNENQIHKDVYSNNDEGGKVILKVAHSDREEACIVCKEIKRLLIKEKSDYKDFCVLYRTNTQSRVIEEELIRQAIPYKIFGGLNFYQRKEIKDIIAYLRLIVNSDDEEAIRRVINYPVRGIGESTMRKITDSARQNHVSIWSVLSDPDRYELDVRRNTKNKLAAFHDFIEEYKIKSKELDAHQLGKEILEQSGLKNEFYSNDSPENVSRLQNIEEFVNALQDFVENKKEEGMLDVYISDFLQEVSLLSNIDDDNIDNTVSLMTIHAAKGLEFPFVFIVGLEENIIPNVHVSSSKEIEEERRLLYVAITRAQNYCCLTYSKSRYKYGVMEFTRPSRFLSEIDPAYINNNEDINLKFNTGFAINDNHSSTSKMTIINKRIPAKVVIKKLHDIKKESNDTYEERDSAYGIKIGDIIEHQRFGIGTIVMLEGRGDNKKATVNFNNVGTKQLLLKFAKYKVIKS